MCVCLLCQTSKEERGVGCEGREVLFKFTFIYFMKRRRGAFRSWQRLPLTCPLVLATMRSTAVPTSRFMLLKSPSTGAGLLMSLTGAMFACLFFVAVFLACAGFCGVARRGGSNDECERWGALLVETTLEARQRSGARCPLVWLFLFCRSFLRALSRNKREKHTPLHAKSCVKARALCCVVFCMSFCGYERRDSRTFKNQVWPPFFFSTCGVVCRRRDTLLYPDTRERKETKGGLRKGAHSAPPTLRLEPRKHPVARSLKLSSRHPLFMPFPNKCVTK